MRGQKEEWVKQKILQDLESKEELSDQQLKDLISSHLLNHNEEHAFSLLEQKRIGKEIFDSLRKWGILQDLLEDDSVTEIMVNGPENIFVERKGRIKKLSLTFASEEKLSHIIQQIVAGCNRVVNEASPIVDARLPNGSRVNVVLPPVSLCGPILTIRRFSDKPMTMEKLLEFGAITTEAAEFIELLVKAKYNILVSGGTGSGKTTFLNAISNFIPGDERIITIEDSAELQITQIPNIIRLETRNANVENCLPITIRDLIKSSLRMRPDRIVVGEVRGMEALDMIGSAMNCGHDGSMSTAHANSAKDLMIRLETMVLMGAELPVQAIRRQISSGVDIVIHLGRLRDKSRKVLEIVELLGIENEEIQMNTLFRFVESNPGKSKEVKGKLTRVGKLQNTYKLETAGIFGVS
ncbi:MAG: CpaF family protein [Lachnospiraceae bacterium]|nr:CpaF family protein [Lachnospiraceae bacterium]